MVFSIRWYVLGFTPILLLLVIHYFYCSYQTSPAASVHTTDVESNGYQFDVLLSLRDLKTHVGFTDHLAKALVQPRVRIFRDDLSVQPGDHVESEVRKAISNSSVYIPVISSAHVSPVFLDELVLMVQQRKANDHLLLPIFYHVHPSVVQSQTGPFCRAFFDLNQELEDASNLRNQAFTQAADPREFCPFHHLNDDAVYKLRQHYFQEVSCLTKKMDDIRQRLLKWKEALNDIGGLKPLHIDEKSRESEAVKLTVDRVVKLIAAKQSLSNALVGDITMKQDFQSGHDVGKFYLLNFLIYALRGKEGAKKTP